MVYFCFVAALPSVVQKCDSSVACIEKEQYQMLWRGQNRCCPLITVFLGCLCVGGGLLFNVLSACGSSRMFTTGARWVRAQPTF